MNGSVLVDEWVVDEWLGSVLVDEQAVDEWLGSVLVDEWFVDPQWNRGSRTMCCNPPMFITSPINQPAVLRPKTH